MNKQLSFERGDFVISVISNVQCNDFCFFFVETPAKKGGEGYAGESEKDELVV
ncbi:MAG: hypothetical protein V7699_01165 [Porticoccus sp.]